ncbi:ABC transporter permease [Petrotoga sp. HKA.pet.4.5]|jgi:ABC-type dipeptide/oligopeptide/nickel transport system permease subunit|uniref:ABC transporter permease n=1 Tax=unclassified Petrotoga TaxID=2620614 RepID=UPI000EF13D2B|nr:MULTISPECIES: ABC transporter permease [unclassified Petrotoga]RLL83806.1 ABC transporter permease [Petrotoga sp. Shatin.DS.tank11.9.2.9.3]RLL90128.1 ABC transporter permease [Petrotoga sp. HKA.pet.4.5]
MKRFLKNFIKNPLNVISIIILGIVIFISFFPGIIAPYDPLKMDSQSILLSPNFTHIFGTDQFGRDIFSRSIYGIQNSMEIALSAMIISSVLGTLLGLLSGYYGGLVDQIISRVIDAFFAFPSLVLALFIVALFGATTFNLIVAIGIVYVPIFARTIRGSVISIRELTFVKAAKIVGKSDFKIMLTVILPNIFSIFIVTFTTNFSTAILTEASLGFLGLGVPPPEPTLGGLVGQGTNFILTAPWLTLLPGAIIAIIVLSINILGDGLRDVLDPKFFR